MEWGCMQALIDYDGWRKWKDINKGLDTNAEKDKDKTSKGAKGKNSAAPGPSPTLKRDKSRLGSGLAGTSSGSGSLAGSDGLDGVGGGIIAVA